MAERDDQLMSDDSIRKAIEAARARTAQAEHDRSELDRLIAVAREEERLLERLLILRGGGAVSDQGQGISVAVAEGQQSRQGAAGGKNLAVQAVVDELEAAQRPIHISELMRLLRERGVPVPGSGRQANLISHIRRDRRVVRPSRGMYALTAWGLPGIEPPRRARRRRKRLRSTTPRQRKADA